MKHTFTYKNKEYSYVLASELEDKDFPTGRYRNEHITEEQYLKRKDDTIKNKRKKYPYIDIAGSFDSEAYSDEEIKVACHWCWQIGLDELCIVGRTWDELRYVLARISKFYCLHSDRRLILWVCFLSYDFSFIKGQLQWETNSKDRPNIFSIDDRETIYGVTANGIEFRDSAIFTGMGLDAMTDFYDLKIQKLLGALDYRLPMHEKSDITDEQFAYIINDVMLLTEWWHSYLYPNYIKDRIHIPLTKTGVPRAELKQNYRDFMRSIDDKASKKFKKALSQSMPESKEEYDFLLNWVYRGGFVHANADWSNKTISARECGLTLGSFDYTSSYPAVMAHEKYGWMFSECETDFFFKVYNDPKWVEDNAFWGVFEISTLEATTTFGIESANKIIKPTIKEHKKASKEPKDYTLDNGRLYSSKIPIKVALTEQDVLSYMEFYGVKDKTGKVIPFGEMPVDELKKYWKCERLKISKKFPLPKYVTDLVYKYYALKTTIKDKDSLDYKIIKSILNAIYGMLCTQVLYDEKYFDTETLETKTDKPIHDYDYARKHTMLLPQWGIWVSAYARRNLLSTLYKLSEQVFYCDTDSIKGIVDDKAELVVKEWNAKMDKLNRNLDNGFIDRALSYQIFKNLGKWDFEGYIDKWRSVGCKRYIYEDKKGIHVKVSGFPDGSYQEYCKDNNLDMFEAFNSELVIDKEHSKRLASKYCDIPYSMTVTDHNGVTHTQYEKSGCALCRTTSSLKITGDYLAFIDMISKRTEMKGRNYV